MNLQSAQHLLPDSIQEIIDIIGLPATVKVVEALGGVTVKFPQRGGKLHPVIELTREAIGEDALNSLADYFAGGEVYIPRCEAALCHLKHQRFIDEVAALTEDGLSITTAVMQLCPKYQFSDRTAWKILAKDRSHNYQKPLL